MKGVGGEGGRGGPVVEGGDFLVPNKKVEHCLPGCISICIT